MDRSCRTLTGRTLLTLGLLFFCAGAAAGWNTGSGDSPTDANIDHEAGQQYHKRPHVYIFEHAIEMLRNDGNDNWANMAEAHLQDLADGARYADHCMGRGYIRVQLELFWGIISANLYEESYPLAGREHYYNPDRAGSGQEGLDLSSISGWAAFMDGFLKFLTSYAASSYTFGFVDLDIDFDPTLKSHHGSAAALCQQKYSSALQAWQQGLGDYQRGSLGTAFFNLGWACHLIQDQAVPNHTYDSYMNNHQEYEDFADGRGGQQGLHASSGGTYSPGLSAHDFCANCAGVGHQPQLFSMVKSGDRSQWASVLPISLMGAERYTAGMIARFMTDLQIPPQTPRATFITASSNAPTGDELPGVYIFYRRDGETNWNMMRSDVGGKFSLNCPPNVKFWIRPAMPGYSFWGSTTLAGDDVLQNQCPIAYIQHPGVFAGTQGRIVLQRHPSPQMQALNIGGPATSMKDMLRTPPEQLVGQLQMAGSGPSALLSSTHLPLSATQVEQGLEDDIRAAAIDVKVTSHILGVPNSATGLPPAARVDLRVYELMSLATGQVITDAQSLTQTIDAARLRTIQAAGASTQQATMQQMAPGILQPQPGQLQPVGGAQPIPQGQQPVTAQTTPQGQQPAAAQAILDQSSLPAWQTVRSRLDTKQVMGGDNKMHQVFVIPGDESSHFSGHTLLRNGVIPVPSLQGCQVTVTPVSGYGYLGFGTQPLTINTDASGKAAFTVQSGSQAGKLRLKISVNHPNLNFMQPSHYVEFFVHPALNGGDPPQVTWASLSPAIQPMTAVVFGQQAPVQTMQAIPNVQRVRLRYDGSRLVGLAQESAVALGAQVPTTVVQVQPGQLQPIQQQPIQQQPIQQQPIQQQPIQQQPIQQQPLPPLQQAPAAMGGAVITETFDTQPQNWELTEGATVANGALTFNQPGMAFWMIPGVSQFTLRFSYMLGQGPGGVGFCVSGEPPNNAEYDLVIFPNELGLLRHRGNEHSELGGAQIQLQQGWNDMAITVAGGSIQVYASGQPVLSAQDQAPLPAGIFRFGSHEGGGTAFDNLQLSSAGGGQPMMTQQPTGVQTGGQQLQPIGGPAQPVETPPIGQQQPGTQQPAGGGGFTESFEGGTPQGWEMPNTATVQNGVLTFSGPGHARTVVGPVRDFRLSFRYRPGGGVASVIMLAGGEGAQYADYALMMPPNDMGFDLNSGGQCQPLAGGPMQWQQGQWHTILVQVMNGQAQVSVNGQVMRTATITQPLQGGGFGFGQLEGSGAAFDDITLVVSN